MIAYLNGAFLEKEKIFISPDDRGFLFADGVYDVIRAYDGRLFQTEAHLRRLERSLRELRIHGLEVDDMHELAQKLIHDNHLSAGDAIVYIQVTRGAARRTHVFPDPPPPPTVYAFAAPYRTPPEDLKRGVKVLLVPDNRWSRCDIKTVALLPNVLARQRAQEAGAQEAVFVRDGAITEGTHTNFCAVFDGGLVTAPKSQYILPGITRQVVLDLCHKLDIPIKQFPILEEKLALAEECMLVGTTVEITPVNKIDGRKVADGKPGPITRRLQQAFYELTHPE
jgi:D-alanine transaminase